jgi:hypothetical protein
MWLRVMPEFDTGKRWLRNELKGLAGALGRSLVLLGSEAFPRFDSGHVFSEDGFGIYLDRTPAEPSPCVAFVFKTGEVWTIDAHHLWAYNGIPFIEPYFIRAFENYTVFLREQLGTPPPYQWIAGIEGVKGRPIEVPLHVPGEVTIQGARGSCMSDTVVVKGTHVEDATPRASLRSFFVEVYDMCTVQRPDWMNDFTWPPMRY